LKRHPLKSALPGILLASLTLFYLNSISILPQNKVGNPDQGVPISVPAGTITLTNTTAHRFCFLYQPINEGGSPDKGVLAAGDKVEFEGNMHIELTIDHERGGLIYWLFPGERYVVKSIGQGGFRIFKMIRDDPTALDLAPHVATPESVIDSVLELIGVRQDSLVYDLGCGNGGILIRAAQKYGARCVGIDIDAGLIRQARKNAQAAAVSSLVRFHNQDIFDTDISRATIVYLYLYPDSLRLLRPFLEKQLKRGTTVVSFDFAFPGWESKLTSRHKIPGESLISKIVHVYRR
jgi:SAM-dependent methyltransferase